MNEPRPQEPDVSEHEAHERAHWASAEPAASVESASLFAAEDRQGMRRRWSEVQTSFVDEPRRSVEQADDLVADAVQKLTQTFENQRTQLEEAWVRGGEVSTEDLRRALQRYRAFFDRLLAI